MKIPLNLNEIESVIRSIFDFYLNPKKCLKIDEKGTLSIQGITAFKLWFYLTLFQILALALISLSKDEFSLYFFTIILTFSLLRIILVGFIAYFIGFLILGIRDYKLSIGYYVILISIISTIGMVFSIPLIEYLGYENTIIHKKISIETIEALPSYFKVLEPLKFLILIISTFVFGMIIPQKIFKISKWKILLWLIIIQIVYSVFFRETIVFYMSELLENKLIE